ncbi:MAG: deoxyuridine 5'-triphosphate nucleotidohydrolase [Bacilli bacterium]|nr:deoxyuridine 5'-triphosphate nucleotidohydrolase [Bacilli bacterium]
MRKFEKITFDQFKKDINDNLDLYNEFKLPKRATKHSAGYDIYSLFDFTLKPNEIIKIPTGIKVAMNENEMLMLVVRGSQGFKYNVRLCNQVGIFESDYYNNETNEGHAWVRLQNHGDKDYVVKKGDAICQAIFTNFLTVDDEEEIDYIRKGGFGSTNGN